MTQEQMPIVEVDDYVAEKMGKIVLARQRLGEVQAQMAELNKEHGELLGYIYGLQCDVWAVRT